jgi:hypothetical protein
MGEVIYHNHDELQDQTDMSRHFGVLGKTPPDSTEVQSPAHSCEYTELIQRLFQGSSVVAIIGAGFGKGVTGICEGIASELSRLGKRVVLVSVNALLQENPIVLSDERVFLPRVGRNVWRWPSPAGQQSEFFKSRPRQQPKIGWILCVRTLIRSCSIVPLWKRVREVRR